ncbi:MAG: hypothetical protein ACK6DM_15935 [Alphaproteobacteria bacterium]
MPVIRLQPDTLDAETARFSQAPLQAPVFLNSVPKSGTHLVRNILRMFVAPEQQYQAQFIQFGNLSQHVKAFDPKAPKLSWGHLLYTDASIIELRGVRKLILVRDPYGWVIARARFFLSDEFEGNVKQLRGGAISVPEFLNLMIFGIHQKAPSMREIYEFNAVAWLGTGASLIRYEDVIANLRALDTPAARTYFASLLSHLGLQDLPPDWQERVRIGADPKHSGTARENLTGSGIELPSVLPDEQKALVDYAVPGLRKLLGYS